MRIRKPALPMENAKRMIELWQRRSQLVEELAEIDRDIDRLGLCGHSEQTATTGDAQHTP